jgi:hypothetical protein
MNSPYLAEPTRLGDVIAAIQAMATYKYYKLDFEGWADRISADRNRADHWQAVFEEHPEFFRLDGERKKASLVWRRAVPEAVQRGYPYPTGASKWNPIEHRLFSEISKNWAGEPLDSYQKILNFIRSTRTQTGFVGHRSPRPSLLPYWHRTNARTAPCASSEAARGPAQVELYDLTQSVK